MNLKYFYKLRPLVQELIPKQNTAALLLDQMAFSPQLVNRIADRFVGTYLISFPKCGVTWLRLMIGKSISEHLNLTHPDLLNLMGELGDEFSTLHPKVPRIRVKHDDDPHKKTPEQLTVSKEHYKYAKVIFLFRDPRDVLVSIFRYSKSRPDFCDTKDYDFSTFLRSSSGSLDTLLTYYNIWAENQSAPRSFLLVRYEDLRKNTTVQLRQILDFLDLEQVSDSVINAAINFSSFENMRALEEKKAFNKLMKGLVQGDRNSFHVRKGVVGGYKEEVTAEDIEYMNSRMKELLTEKSLKLYFF